MKNCPIAAIIGTTIPLNAPIFPSLYNLNANQNKNNQTNDTATTNIIALFGVPFSETSEYFSCPFNNLSDEIFFIYLEPAIVSAFKVPITDITTQINTNFSPKSPKYILATVPTCASPSDKICVADNDKVTPTKYVI